MKKRVCPKCGEKSPLSTYTCLYCNASLSGAKIEEIDDSLTVLNVNKSSLGSAPSKTCPHCGQPVRGNTCPVCGSFVLTSGTRTSKPVEPKKTNSDKKMIAKTVIVNTDSRKSATSSITRGMIGGALFGVAGAVGGAMSGKNKSETTFLIVYTDGSRETQTVKTMEYFTIYI
jgi:uncharacterized Zn finger protein (UPF0148 family)